MVTATKKNASIALLIVTFAAIMMTASLATNIRSVYACHGGFGGGCGGGCGFSCGGGCGGCGGCGDGCGGGCGGCGWSFNPCSSCGFGGFDQCCGGFGGFDQCCGGFDGGFGPAFHHTHQSIDQG
ncbi:MAG TPA: hypothetical protein VIY08_14040, partial [Candidatus Nitrosocosmicus sp.]